MPTLLHAETIETDKPILLISGEHPLINTLISYYSQDFKIVLISESNHPTHERNDLYIINASSSYLLDKLVEKVEYILSFLSSESDKRIAQHVLAKSTRDSARTTMVIPLEKRGMFYDLIHEYKHYSYISFLFLGEIFSLNPHEKSFLSKTIQSGLLTSKIKLTGNDLFPIFPISTEDAITGINLSLFSTLRKRRNYFLYYENPQTLISLVHLLKRVEPELEFEFANGHDSHENASREEIEQEIIQKSGVAFNRLDSHLLGFEKSLQHLQENLNESNISVPEDHKEVISAPSQKKPFEDIYTHPISKRRARKTGLLLKIILYSCFLFIGINVVISAISFFYFYKGVQAAENYDLNQTASYLKTSNTLFSFSKPSLLLGLDVISNVIHNESLLNQALFALMASDFFHSVSTSIEKMQSQRQDLTLGEANMLFSDLVYLFMQSQEFHNSGLQSYTQKIFTPQIKPLIALSPILPEILGFQGERNYLLLFQNNAELRPTGGFIGSVGELTIFSGKIKSLSIKDVYDYDGQLKAHVEPYYIVRRYLQPHLYLRDSNFDPDFENSASMSALLYNLETGKKVSGVIAVDFEVLKQILKAVGPIKLTDYNKTIDENSAFDFLQQAIDKKFFPGSTEKKELLNELFNQITIKIENDPNLRVKLLRIFPDLLSEKHILVALQDQSLQGLLRTNNFSGSFQDFREKKENVLYDFLSINEANIGVNKENLYVEREVSYSVHLDQNNEISSQVILTLRNRNDGREPYKTYTRIFTPLGSSLSSIKINHAPQTITPAVSNFREYEQQGFKAPAGLEVNSAIENNKQVFGFITTVDKGTTQIIEVNYKNGLSPVSQNLFTYSLSYIKQPGTLPYPLSVQTFYKQDFAPQNVTHATFGQNSVIFSDTIKKDTLFNIELLKK